MKSMTHETVQALFVTVACTKGIDEECVALLKNKHDVHRWLQKVQTPRLAREVALDAFEAVFTRCMQAGWEEHDAAMHAFDEMLVATLPVFVGAVNVQSPPQLEFLRRVILGLFPV